MKQVFYIHGGSAFESYEDFLNHLRTIEIKAHAEKPKRWSDSLGEDLGEGYEVFKPAMPNKYNSKYEEWKIWFERHFEFLHGDVILIGWSQGGMFLVKYLLENVLPFKVKALYLVAAPYENLEFEGESCGDFVFDTNRVGEIAEKAGKIALFHSKDDFVVPYEHALKYKEILPEAELVSFEDKNHFLVEELPELVEKIKSL